MERKRKRDVATAQARSKKTKTDAHKIFAKLAVWHSQLTDLKAMPHWDQVPEFASKKFKTVHAIASGAVDECKSIMSASAPSPCSMTLADAQPAGQHATAAIRLVQPLLAAATEV